MQRLFAKRIMVWIMSFSMVGTSLPTPGYAGMIGTQTLIEARQANDPLARVEEFISQERVQTKLIGLGADPAEVRERVAALTDEELQELNQKMDTMPAGGLLEVLGVVFVVLIILELTGVIDIFKKV